MIFYTQTKFTATVVGARIVSVICENCGCNYYFELRRVGTGVGVAPYSLGEDRAEQSASENANQNIADRLEGEAELVPCPKCHWINEELVAAYRKSSYAGCAALAIVVALVGIVIGLVGAWFISIGPPADHGALPYLLIHWPLTMIGLATSAALLVVWLKSRIQPNADHPMKPKVPAGTPQALILEPGSGQLVVASTEADQSTTDFEFHLGKHRIPSECCACLEPTDSKNVISLAAVGATKLEFPRCERCTAKATLRGWQVRSLFFISTALPVALIVFSLKLESFEFWLLFCSGLVIALCVGAAAATFSDRDVKVVKRDESRGIVFLAFRNTDYGKRVGIGPQVDVVGSISSPLKTEN